MSDEGLVEIRVDKFRTTKQQKLLRMLNDKGVRAYINGILKNYINIFVPSSTGDEETGLRGSARATPDSIIWGEGLAYAHYQYEGEVYGPNVPGAVNGQPAWKSESVKYPTGRELGVPGSAYLRVKWYIGSRPTSFMVGNVKAPWLLYEFGYSTPGTGHHWDERFNKDRNSKRQANLEITRYLKAECKNRGLS